MSATKLVQCPVCNKHYRSDIINAHVNNCLGADNDASEPVSKKRKSNDGSDVIELGSETGTSNVKGWGFLMGSSNTQSVNTSKEVKSIGDNWKNTKLLQEETICIDTADGNDRTEMKVNGPSQSDKSENVSNIRADLDTQLDMGVPLAEQMRPTAFEDYVGQDNAVGKEKMLATLLKSDIIPSMILWGPPGCGKTTLAKIIAHKCKTKAKFVKLSATSSGVNDVKETIKLAKNDHKMLKKRTILFLDEIHRFNKLQQDSLLPHVEDGTITLIGATTENPSFQVNNALLSRCRVIVLDKLDTEALMRILIRATERLGLKVLTDGKTGGHKKWIEKPALEFLANVSDGDARAALNGLQSVVQSQIAASKSSHEAAVMVVTVNHIKDGLQRSHIAYDKTGEEHYNAISALHKSMRGSDDSAALYWLARMLEGGEEPLYIARRLIEFAGEDVGLADTQALILAVNTFQACHFIGKPECEKPLAVCVVYLSRASKSVEAYNAYSKAKACIHEHKGPLPGVPLHLRNAPTKLMKNLGYGKDYKYNPSFKGPVKQDYFPECLKGTNFFK
ncbi:ATPase WRNIP1-like [Dreissena polymorpha]|uniref:UBZ4-type domain-containing protein n=1 Tax=Dreissena polymorpha TaxID=45954 RepID=A0A9D4EFI5_DREPO|nr:ATPase WRNIP1-like [Dreissena polymorpha]KAH3778703.1 hypothetical protein DPMN_180173 [Dreissena polymorpha]